MFRVLRPASRLRRARFCLLTTEFCILRSELSLVRLLLYQKIARNARKNRFIKQVVYLVHVFLSNYGGLRQEHAFFVWQEMFFGGTIVLWLQQDNKRWK